MFDFKCILYTSALSFDIFHSNFTKMSDIYQKAESRPNQYITLKLKKSGELWRKVGNFYLSL